MYSNSFIYIYIYIFTKFYLQLKNIYKKVPFDNINYIRDNGYFKHID